MVIFDWLREVKNPIFAFELMNKIIKERYSKDWNIYAAQASDGDVWNRSDADDCYKLLVQ